jgi:hypothetical protein
MEKLLVVGQVLIMGQVDLVPFYLIRTLIV